MNRLLFLLCSWLVCSLYCCGAEVDELIIKREIVAKKLEKHGYSKWMESQKEYIAQSSRVESLSYKSKLHKNDYLKLVLNYQKLQKIQRLEIEQKAEEDVDAAMALALDHATKNADKEAEIEKLKKHQEKLDDLLVKHQKLRERLEVGEVEIRNQIQANRNLIDPLLKEWMELDVKIKEIEDAEGS